MRSKEIRAKRAQLVQDAQALSNKPEMTAEDRAQFDAMMAQVDTMKADIDRIERAAALESELRESLEPVAASRGISVDQVQDETAREKRIMTAYLRGNMSALNAADREHFQKRLGPVEGARNAAGTTTGGAGYIIAPGFQRELLIAMKAQGGMRTVARTMETDTGVPLPWPTMDDTAQVATIIGENTQITPDTDLTFGSVSIGAFTYKSGVLPVSLQLLQDSAFDFDALIRDAMAGRFVRGQNAHFTNGTGVGQPQGAVTGAPLGFTGESGETDAFIFDDLIELEHSVDPVYRVNGSYMFHDSTLKALRKLKDNEGRYLWQAGANSGVPDTINNRPYVVNQDMPVMAAGAKSVLFGDFKNYLIRDALGMQMMVLRERYADLLQVGYIAYMRTDGRLISAAQPIKYLANAAA